MEIAALDGRCELEVRQNVTSGDVLDVFQSDAYRDRISLFHYGGHANGYELEFESGSGGSKPAHAESFAAFLGQQAGLCAVFLNGFSTRRQVDALLDAGVSIVIATSQAIVDEVATEFADRFYTGLAGGATIRAAFEEALDYCKVRIQGGKPLVEHQWIQQKLFEMFTKVESSRAISRAAMIYNHETLPPAIELSIASKVHCTQAAYEVSHDAVQLFGGYGLSKEYTIEKIFRDARASLIEDGCNEVLALAGAKAVLEKY